MRTRWRSRVAAGVAVIATVVTGCAGPVTPPPAPTGPPAATLPDRVSGPDVMRYLRDLHRIAQDNDGNRATPGPGYAASVDYAAGVLRRAGYQVGTPSYPVDGELTSRNVVAQTRTGNPDHVIMLGAHLDSVSEGPGINDNGSGVAALLEIATKLGGAPAVRNTVRLGLWGSEEDEMQGSTDYVRTLSGVDRARVATYVNLDMLASPNAGYFVQGGRGGGQPRSGPPGSAAVADVLVDQLTDAGVTAQQVAFDGGSDFVAFIDAGIPSAGVMAGDEQRKTPRQVSLWGGRAGQVFDACYHTACDGIGNINETALDRYTHAIAGTVARLATSPRPRAH